MDEKQSGRKVKVQCHAEPRTPDPATADGLTRAIGETHRQAGPGWPGMTRRRTAPGTGARSNADLRFEPGDWLDKQIVARVEHGALSAWEVALVDPVEPPRSATRGRALLEHADIGGEIKAATRDRVARRDVDTTN